jgi:hypothetical protein
MYALSQQSIAADPFENDVDRSAANRPDHVHQENRQKRTGSLVRNGRFAQFVQNDFERSAIRSAVSSSRVTSSG